MNTAFISNITLGHCLSLFYTEFSYLQNEGDNRTVRHIIISNSLRGLLPNLNKAKHVKQLVS